MSVYKHDYRAYSGRVTPMWARIGVLVRYGLAEAWSSRITIGLGLAAVIPFVIFLVQIYLANNPATRMLVSKNNLRFLDVDTEYFLRALEAQCWFSLPLMSWVAPRLITYDLADNALPILLSHPVSRFGYVMGKFIALFATLASVTLLPCLVLFVYQCYCAPPGWTMANLSIVVGIVAGTAIWIIVLSMVGLAFSSWVKWRTLATGVIFAAVFVPAGVGGIVTAVLRTKWGMLFNLPFMMTQLWQRLLGAPETIRVGRDWSLPSTAILIMLMAACLVCAAMLNARIRAREVVRG
jgi:ABC-type transport system involved in multi-copper enzyme maturation permease subunit